MAAFDNGQVDELLRPSRPVVSMTDAEIAATAVGRLAEIRARTAQHWGSTLRASRRGAITLRE
jgi:hypothetical protein